MANFDGYFHWADYLVFALSLSMSLGIGIFYAIKDKNKKNNVDFLLAGRNMKIFPMVASTFATVVPPVGFISMPVEVYYFGFGFIFNAIGACLGTIPLAEIMAPAFHKLNLTSAFEYLEERFNGPVRTMASVLQTVMVFMILGMFTYAPAVALAQVSGLSIYIGIVITTTVCTIYTTFGGMKAIIWSDALQVFLMFAGIITLVFKSAADLGGFGKMFEIAYDGGRINQFNLSPDPFVRSSIWSYLIGSFFACFVQMSSNQLSIQRYGMLQSCRDLKIALYMLIPMYFVLSVFFLLTGLSMYAHFSDCDPLVGGQIKSMDQMVPFLVMKVLGVWPGMPGLFIACMFAASLSTVSSGQNGLAATILKDLVEPNYRRIRGREPSIKHSFFIAKAIAFIAGIMIMLMAFLVKLIGGGLFQILNKFMGIFVGPIGSLFTIAIIIKPLKDIRAVMAGFCMSTVVGIAISIGSEIYKFKPDILPIGLNCFPSVNSTQDMWSNFTHSAVMTTAEYTDYSGIMSPEPTFAPKHQGFLRVFNLHPLYYNVMCYGLSIVVAVIVDQCIKKCHKRSKRKNINGKSHIYSVEVAANTNSQQMDRISYYDNPSYITKEAASTT